VKEESKLKKSYNREQNWLRWGPYLPERQWGTVREDYSEFGTCWDYFPHDQARSRVYRWGEDGLMGLTDREGRLCFSVALWNGKDPILKERLFGLNGNEGNHAEDVKENFYYQEASPSHSYNRATYLYPHKEYPYAELVEENRRRNFHDAEYDLNDTAVFDEGWYEVEFEYAKAEQDDILIKINIHNCGSAAELHLLPGILLRNTWSWGRTGEGYWPKGQIDKKTSHAVCSSHQSLGEFYFCSSDDNTGEWIFTENETNPQGFWQGVTAAL